MDARTTNKTKLPSRHVTEGPERAPHRSYYYAMGLTQAQVHQPFVGVATCWNEAAPCNIFKRTPYVADLKPGGRYVAKDLFEAGGVPLLMKTLLDHGHLHGECLTVTGRSIAESVGHVGPEAAVGGPIALLRDGDVIELDADHGTLNVHLSDEELARRKAQWKSRDGDFASGYLWKYAQQVGPALAGAVTHPGGVAEKQCYADI